MKLISPPEATACKGTPSLPGGFVGVAMLATRKTLGGTVQVNGAFRVPAAESEAIGQPLHRALVLAVWSAGGYQESVMPFREVVLFPDDEIHDGGNLWGAFRFEVALPPGEGFYLHMALGPHLSASVLCPP